MKNACLLFLLVVSSFIYGQNDAYKLQELDKTEGVYEMQFAPDALQKEVISSYMEGTTETDSLKFWVAGTHTLQNVMVTVLSPNPDDPIKVTIVKRHWNDAQRSGFTKKGRYQETFNTAGKFGIVLTSDQPNIPFKIAVWTSGEIRPNMNNLFVPVSNTSAKENDDAIEKNGIASLDISRESNTLLYSIIGLLVLIAILIVVMVVRKKPSKTLLIVLALTAGQTAAYANAFTSTAFAFKNLMSKMKFDNFGDFVNTTNDYAQIAQGLMDGANGTDLLHPDFDRDSKVEIDPAGSPGLESSCIPETTDAAPRDGRDGVDGRDGRDGQDGRDGRDGQDGSASNGDGGNNGTNGNEGQNGSDGNSGNDGIDGNNGNDGDKPKYDNQGRPKYDSNGNPINYDNSKYPKYDKDGNPIHYGEIDPKGDFDYQGRPKYDAKGQPIHYDTSKYPKYDKDGNPINYSQEDVENPPKKSSETYSGGLALVQSKTPASINNLGIGLNYQLSNTIPYETASILPISFLKGKKISKQKQEEGCACLEAAYNKLNDRRYYFEQLRIIYKNAMTGIDGFLTYWDGASGIHGATAIAWQNYKKDFIPKTKGPLNRAYDSKYKEMIQGLEKTLKQIDKCEKMLGNDRWYNQSGFIYYSFMADRYKRD